MSAWTSDHRLMLGQMKVDSKSHEIKAIKSVTGIARYQWLYYRH
ncbi:MAG: hypothetical protein QNJ72_39835 [Pleurocapsa sp. MO_226.B13]|nr:hypothetical protein [Pleurocapsa sp. MO_226.B13]